MLIAVERYQNRPGYIPEVLNVLEVCLCKPAIYNLKILGGGKFEYYKSIGGTTKKGGTKFLKFSGRGAKGGDYDF